MDTRQLKLAPDGKTLTITVGAGIGNGPRGAALQGCHAGFPAGILCCIYAPLPL